MRFDDILSHIGEFGFFQKRYYFLICLAQLIGAMQVYSVLFILDIPDHRCSLGENDTFAEQSTDHAHLLNLSIPWETYRGHPVRSSCSKFKDPLRGDNQTVGCDTWVFDKSIYRSTLTEEFSIVCSDRILRSHSNMASYSGQLVGAVFMGALSDRFGRRPLFLASTVVRIAAYLGTAFVPNMYVFMAMRIISSLAGLTCFTSSFVLSMELIGPSKRVQVGMIVEFIWCFGLFLLGLLAYFVRDWQVLLQIIVFPSILFLGYFWVVPESPRWLISRGRITEAREILKKMAAANGSSLPEEMLESIETEQRKSDSLIRMFTSRYLLLMILVIFFNWLSVNIVYSGLSLNVQNLSGNIYLNFTIGNIMELTSYVACITLMDRLGRKALHCACMCVGGLACLATMFPVMYGTAALDWVTVLLSMVGKFGISGAFAILYIYTAELFPTIVRNSGVGASSFFARVGGMVSPYIADLGVLVGGDLQVALPLVVFGAFSVAAGLLSLYLPETRGKKLPDTVQDAINMRKHKKKQKDREDTTKEAMVTDTNLS